MAMKYSIATGMCAILLVSGISIWRYERCRSSELASESSDIGYDQTTDKTAQLGHEFAVVSPPVEEETIKRACEQLEALLRTADEPSRIPEREQYVRDFVAVLHVCDQRDRFRNDRWQIDEEIVVSTEPPVLRLSQWTTGRVIRRLGDLGAKEAVDAIAEFLLIMHDTGGPDLPPASSGLPRAGDVPAHWALFQIGDAALPVLRAKMNADDGRVRNSAQHAAVEILGPRSSHVLQRWIDEAATSQERDRLGEARTMFQIVSDNTRTQSPEAYRAEFLRKGRERIVMRLQRRDGGKKKGS